MQIVTARNDLFFASPVHITVHSDFSFQGEIKNRFKNLKLLQGMLRSWVDGNGVSVCVCVYVV